MSGTRTLSPDPLPPEIWRRWRKLKSDRKLVRVTVAFLLGILLARYRSPLFLLLLALLLMYLYRLEYGAGRRKEGLIRCLLLLGIFLLGVLRYQSAEIIWDKAEKAILTDQEILLEGQIYQKEIKNQNQIYYLKHTFLHQENNVIPCQKTLLYLDSDQYSIGETLLVSGEWKPMKEARNFGNFDQKRFYRSRKIDVIFYGKSVRKVMETDLPVERTLWEIREKLRSVYTGLTPKKDAGILCTMLLGDKSVLDTELKELYQTSGISHILAISGLHISLLGLGLFRLLKLLKMRELPAVILAGLLIVLYTIMTGSSPSAIRACIMFLLTLPAQTLRRSYDSLTALSLAALLLLLENPFLTDYSGFVFSFGAVLSVVVFGRVMTMDCRSKALRALLVSFSIQLVTLPIVMWEYFEIPLYACFLNLLILPFVGVILGAGVLGGLLGVIGAVFPARIVLFIPHLILLLYEKACILTEKLPGASLITGRPAPWMLVLYYVALCLCFLLATNRRKRGYSFLPVVMLALLLVLPKRHGFELSILDVGQGDGIFLATGAGTAFIDGGSSDVKQVGKYRIEPFLKAEGVRRIDYWLVTHTDLDHISGLKELLEDGYRVETIVFSKYVYKDEALEELVALAKTHGTKVRYLSPGQEIHFGEAALRCVFPDRDYAGADKNSLSLVTLFEDGDFSALLTGDISAKEEQYLLDKYAGEESLTIDFYKAAHHGSKYSNSEEFLKQLSPEAAAVSCGEKNRYGHPAAEALSNMESAGAEIYDTRAAGQIKVTLPHRRMKVETFLQGS